MASLQIVHIHTCAIHSGSLNFKILIIAPINEFVDRVKVNSNCLSDSKNWNNNVSKIGSIQ